MALYKNCGYYSKVLNKCYFKGFCFRLPYHVVSHVKCRPIKSKYIKPKIFVQLNLF